MPFPLQTADHPLSPSRELWDSILGGLRDNRAAFVSESLPGVFAIQAGNEIHPKTLEHFERIVAEADGLAIVKTVEIFNQPAEAAIKKLAESPVQIPILAVHGDSDQGMPLEASAQIVKEMVPWVDLKVYETAGHGTCFDHLISARSKANFFFFYSPLARSLSNALGPINGRSCVLFPTGRECIATSCDRKVPA